MDNDQFNKLIDVIERGFDSLEQQLIALASDASTLSSKLDMLDAE